MRKVITIFLILISFTSGFAQELPAAYRAYNQRFPEGPALNNRDSLYLMNIPEKTMPEYLLSSPLPPLVDNSTRPYLRPVFSQVGASCGQAAMIGYNFTYEMAYRRDQPADIPQTQYPTHFTWNFQNGGGWYGVSYFHSLEILRLCGCMNVYDYGDYYDDGSRWINGYDRYYNGMFNRIKGVYSIRTGTAEGLLALKHWLFDHMGEGDAGGVASYYANTPWNSKFLNDTTPEGGKYVVTAWYPSATHAMTIVGYNDSIRWDYNYDHQYTNNIDLNGDSILDPRDWEIGAFKFVDSHGPGELDSGYCYLMYKCLAETFESGGVWNQAVHILDIDENYQPLVTYKVTLKHNYRQKVKVLAGVSRDTTDIAPAWIMDFPIINYQGGNRYLQGQDTADYLQYLEFGLDITPLLSHLQPGEPAKFFLIVDENDPYFEGEGEINSFSVMDYTSGVQEIHSTETPVIMENNSRTSVSVIYFPVFDLVEITTDTLPLYSVNEPYSYQLAADGGTPPYSWDPQYQYRIEQSMDNFPETDSNQVLFSAATDSIVPVALGFSFPYYGILYDTVYMHINGHLQFDHSQLPWPYMQEPDIYFRGNRVITPMNHTFFTIMPADGDGGWFEADDTSAVFRWKLSWSSTPAATDLNFAVKIFQNGNIEFFYGSTTLEGIPWIGGISAGNNTDFIESPVSGSGQVPAGQKISFIYRPFPLQLNFSENGLLTGTLTADDFIYDLAFRATDRSGISATKTLQFSSGPYLFFTVHDNGDDQIDYGDTVILDLEVRNNSLDTLHNALVGLTTNNPFVEMPDQTCLAGTLLPGQAITVPGAFTFTVSLDVPDQSNLLFNTNLTTSEKVWHKELIFAANAPDLKLSQVIIADNDNGWLDPGETAPMMITLQNTGHAAIDGVSAELIPLGEEVNVLENPVQVFGMLGKGASVTRAYTLQAEDTTPNGLITHLILAVETMPGLQSQDSIKLKIGRTPVLVIDMGPNNYSGPDILAQLNELNVINEYGYRIPYRIDNYQSLFVCLGYHFSNHELTWGEGKKLADYLDNGGRIYMEGRKTWKDDPWTPVYPKFFLNPAGSVTIFDTLTGVDGTFIQGFSLLNEAINPFSFYYIEPISPAFTILQDNDNLKACAIAYDAGNYKTIGTLFEFSTLTGLPPTTARDLMLKYLEFFDIAVNPIWIEERPDLAGGLDLYVYPNPASRQLTVSSQQSAVGSQRSAVRLTITDLFGRRIKEFDNLISIPYLIDVSDLMDGLYILQVIGEDGETASAKFLKISQ
jgi:hypothetical protein